MEAASGRRVRSGREYDHLFPLPNGKDTVIHKSADVAATVRFIQEAVPQISWQTDRIVREPGVINGDSLDDICSSIWHFIYRHIPYAPDEAGVEQIRSPRRAWHHRHKVRKDGKVGCDCDCYSVMISSMLMSLGNIPHFYRIAKYPKEWPEVPRWQHIYVVVPRSGKLDGKLTSREDYIVIDPVKDNYDDEHFYLEVKDYGARKRKMKLEFLDGIDEQEEYVIPKSVDVRDFADTYDEEELGKLGQWIKKAVKNVGSTVKTVANKVVDAAGDAMRAINKVANPVTILLRNGFLLAMKINMLNVARRMRYAYLNDDQANKMGIDINALNKLRKIKDKAETVYWQAGGEKSNLRKAILEGKGNGDKRVPLAGLGSIGSGWVMEQDGHIPALGELGEPATATALATATAAVGAVAAALKQVKDLFKPNAPAQENFDSESEDAPPAAPEMPVFDMSTLIPMTTDTAAPVMMASSAQQAVTAAPTVLSKAATPNTVSVSVAADVGATQKPGFFSKAGTWVKENPGKTTLIGLAVVTVVGGSIWAVRKYKKKKGTAMNGLPRKRKSTKRKRKPGLSGVPQKRKPKRKAKRKTRVRTLTIS